MVARIGVGSVIVGVLRALPCHVMPPPTQDDAIVIEANEMSR
jgi:hypothetical protein